MAQQTTDRRRLAVLGLPTLGLALSITTVTTYFPAVARSFTNSSTLIGLVIASEGALALWLPIVSGSWSDRLETPLGRRLPFLIAGTPVIAGMLVLLGLVGSLGTGTIVLVLFFAAYYATYEPYRALYPDTVPEGQMSRAQSIQALWRGTGTGLALVAGGLLLSVRRWLPFLVAAVVLLAAAGVFVRALYRSEAGARPPRSRGTVRAEVRRLARLVRDQRPLRAFLLANGLWETSLGALKTFVVLFITQGVGLSLATAAAILGGAALVVAVAAGTSGRLGDRLGPARVVAAVVPVYGAGLALPFFSQSAAVVLPAGAVVAFGGGVLMALPYALLAPLMPSAEHGALSGLYSMSRGVGIMAGPLLAGGAVDLMRRALPGTHGYAAMWLIASAAILASIPFARRLRRAEARRTTP